MQNGKVVRFAPPVPKNTRRYSDATLRYEAARQQRIAQLTDTDDDGGESAWRDSLDLPDTNEGIIVGEVAVATGDGSLEEEEAIDNDYQPMDTNEQLDSLLNDTDHDGSESSNASTGKIDHYIKVALTTEAQRHHPLQTTFTTIGPATEGTRRRIRFRHNRKDDSCETLSELDEEEGERGDSKQFIQDGDLEEIRDNAWVPRIYKCEIDCEELIDFGIPYSHAWEIGRRGSIAFQAMKWTLLGSWLPRITTRYLILDGTDPMCFLSVYRRRRGIWRLIKVYGAEQLLDAYWDPVGGSLLITSPTSSSPPDEYLDMSQAFVGAALICLREMSVWSSIASQYDTSSICTELSTTIRSIFNTHLIQGIRSMYTCTYEPAARNGLYTLS